MWGWGWGGGAGLLRTRRGRGRGLRCIELVGEGRAGSRVDLRGVGWDGLSFHTPRPHLHPGEALTRHRGGGRCAGLPGSSALTTPHVHGRPGLFPPRPALLHSPPSRRDPGHRWAGVVPSRPSFRNVRERNRGWLPFLLPGPHYDSQRAAPPRASAAEAVPAGSWSPQRPRRSLTPTGRGSWPPARGPPTVLALDPGSRPAVLPIEGGRGRWASRPLVSEPCTPFGLHRTLSLVKVALIWESCFGVFVRFLF